MLLAGIVGIAARYRLTWVLLQGCHHHQRHRYQYPQRLVAAVAAVVAAVAAAGESVAALAASDRRESRRPFLETSNGND